MNKHGGYYGSKKNEIIDFSVNINPLGVSNIILEEMKKNIQNIVRYPEIDGETGKKIIADELNLNKQEIVLGNGAIELIYLFARSVKAKKVLIIQPTFNEYERAFNINGSEVYHFINEEDSNFSIDIDKLMAKIDQIKPSVVVLCNPNNPTGGFINHEAFKPVLRKLKELGAYLFLDESFIDFTEETSYASLINRYPIFIIRSMTKFFAIPGSRLGYAIGNKKIIQKINKFKEPWTINSIALSILPHIFKDYGYIEKTKKWCTNEKKYLSQELKSLEGIRVFPSYTNFYLCKLQDMKADELQDILLKDNIYIRTCEDFYGLGEEYFRIAVKRHEENMGLIDALRRLKR